CNRDRNTTMRGKMQVPCRRITEPGNLCRRAFRMHRRGIGLRAWYLNCHTGWNTFCPLRAMGCSSHQELMYAKQQDRQCRPSQPWPDGQTSWQGLFGFNRKGDGCFSQRPVECYLSLPPARLVQSECSRQKELVRRGLECRSSANYRAGM